MEDSSLLGETDPNSRQGEPSFLTAGRGLEVLTAGDGGTGVGMPAASQPFWLPSVGIGEG